MGRGWSILFAVTMLACGISFAAAPLMGMWLPEGVSTHSGDVDFLFYVILIITGFFFILTEAILVVFMYQYAGQPGQRSGQAAPKKSFWASLLRPVTGVLNTQHRVEMAWTVVPAAILLYIAFAQVSTWANVKYQSRMATYMEGRTPIQIEVSARQFEWRVRYPSYERTKEWLAKKVDMKSDVDFTSFAKVPHQDDVHLVNEVHTFKGQPVLVQLKTIDVLHSFNLPHMRVKQDALPGKTIPVWFTATKTNTKKKGERWEDEQIWEIACAELCGWGHYRMIGRVYVHETEADFLDWLRYAEQEDHRKAPK